MHHRLRKLEHILIYQTFADLYFLVRHQERINRILIMPLISQSISSDSVRLYDTANNVVSFNPPSYFLVNNPQSFLSQ